MASMRSKIIKRIRKNDNLYLALEEGWLQDWPNGLLEIEDAAEFDAAVKKWLKPLNDDDLLNIFEALAEGSGAFDALDGVV
jgi:hypothetical protein